MALLPRDGDQLEQAFLEGTQLDVGEAEPDDVRRLSECGALRETRRVVGDEVASLPVRVEDRGDLRKRIGLRTPDTRTFHSSPVTCAEWVRLDEPTYAVEYSPARWKSHALACSRVMVVSYETRTSAPIRAELVKRPLFGAVRVGRCQHADSAFPRARDGAVRRTVGGRRSTG